MSRMSEFSEEVETLRKQLLEKELELKEKDELLKRWEGAVTKPDGSSYGLHEHHTPLCHGAACQRLFATVLTSWMKSNKNPSDLASSLANIEFYSIRPSNIPRLRDPLFWLRLDVGGNSRNLLF